MELPTPRGPRKVLRVNDRTDAAYMAWHARFARPAQDIRDLRNDLRDGVVDFGAFEMSDR